MYISISIWNLFIQFIFLRKRSHRKANMIYYIEIISCKQVRAASRANTTCRQCHTPQYNPPSRFCRAPFLKNQTSRILLICLMKIAGGGGGGKPQSRPMAQRFFSNTFRQASGVTPSLSPFLHLASLHFSHED